MHKTLLSCIVFLALFSQVDVTSASDLTAVTELIVEGANRGYARTSIPVNTQQCGGDSTVHRFDPSTDYGKTLLSVLMAAKLSGETVRVLQNGCDDWQRPILLGVWLVPSPQ